VFTIGVALLVAGYGSLYTGVLHLLALKNGGQLPAFKNDQAQPAPSLLQAFGFATPLGPAVGKQLGPTPDLAPAGSTTTPAPGGPGAPEQPGPVTININGKPVSITPGLLPGIIIGPAQPAPTQSLVPVGVF